MDEGLDTGDILCQKKITLNYNNDTLESSYEKLQEVMIELFLENWDDIKNNKIIPIKQDDSIKTIHYLKHNLLKI